MMEQVEKLLRESMDRFPGSRASKFLLSEWGIKEETAVRYHLGYLPDGVQIGTISIPRGILLPQISPDGNLKGARVRRPVPPLPGPEFSIVPGSEKYPFGAHLLRNDRPLIVCKNEFDAMLVAQEAGDIVDTIAWWESSFSPLRFISAPQWFVVTNKYKTWTLHFWNDVPLCALFFETSICDFAKRGGNVREIILSCCTDQEDPLISSCVVELGGVCTTGFFVSQRLAIMSGRYSPKEQASVIRQWEALNKAEKSK